MKRFQKILAATVFLVANTTAWSAGFTAPAQIVGIDVGNTNKMIVRLSGNTECGTPLVQVSRDQPYYKDMLATANIAYAGGKNVQAWIVSCDGGQGTMVRMVMGSVW